MCRRRSCDPSTELWAVVCAVPDTRGSPVAHGKRILFRTSCTCGVVIQLYHCVPRPYACPSLQPLNNSSRIRRTHASYRPVKSNKQGKKCASALYNHATQLSHIQKVDLFLTPTFSVP